MSEAYTEGYILITGGTGFIGKILCARLKEKGYRLIILTRSPHKYKDQQSQSQRFLSSLDELTADTPIHTVINLAGEPLAEGRWTEAKKKRFVDSRVDITSSLINLMTRLDTKPDVFLSSSAIGYYGPQADTEIVEESPAVGCFLHDLCQKWEAAALSAQALGVRCCLLRIGMVLGPEGGPFDQFRLPFAFKVAAHLGTGEQWMSWIHQDDIIEILFFLMENTQAEGPINLTAPQPVTNAQFTSMVGERMRAWISLGVPAPLVRFLTGELGEEVLLVSQRVLPRQLLQLGYRFRYEELGACLDAILP